MKTFNEFINENADPVPVLKKWGSRNNYWHVYNSITKKDTDWSIEKVSNKEWILTDPNGDNIQTFPSLAKCKYELRNYAAAFNPEI